VLGEGGMARVYLARHYLLNTPAAVKVLEARGEPGPDQAERFRREARNLFRLKHPHVVEFLEFGVLENLRYLAVEHVDGADLGWVLRQYRRRGERVPVAEGVEVLRQAAAALDYVHDQGIVHRDVKPSNILLDRRGRALLTDFGLALSSSETSQGAVFGSANYVSPEQALSSEQAVAQSDLYSLGVVAYEILLGRIPFEGDTPIAVALKHMNDPVPPPRTVDPDFPPALEDVLLRALAKSPQDRWPSSSEFARALGEAAQAARATPGWGEAAGAGIVVGIRPSRSSDGRSILDVVAERPALPQSTRPVFDTAGPIRLPRRAAMIAAGALLGLLGVITIAVASPGGDEPWETTRSPDAPASAPVPAGNADAPASPGQPEDREPQADGPSEGESNIARASGAPVFNIASCHGYRFVSRLEPGMHVYAVWHTPVYDKPRYEHDAEAGDFVAVVEELAPGEGALVLDHESYPNCFAEARFWKVRTDSGAVGWAPEWRFFYYLEP